MADSKRQKIVDAVVMRMKLINGSGSYETNLASRVEDSRTNWDENELPAISVFDGDSVVPDPESQDHRSKIIQTMPVLIRGYVKQGTTAAVARKLLKDIMTAIRVDDKWTVTGTPLVMQTRQVRDSIVRERDSFEVEACEIEIQVQVILGKFNAEA
jgi:hypothetical protein